MRDLIGRYVESWKRKGYPDDLPDEVPAGLMTLGLAPSYKAICLAILRNDHAMISLGFVPRVSLWYMALKRIEIQKRGDRVEPVQLRLF